MNLDATGVAALRRAQSALKLVDLPAGDLGNYSLRRAVQLALDGDESAAGFEAIICDEYLHAGYQRQSRKHSIFVPAEVIFRNLAGRGMRAAYQTGGNGASLVENAFRGDLFIDALRPRSRVLQLGATTITNLQGNVTIPRLDTASSAYWLPTPSTSSVAITESEGTFDSTPLTVAPALVGALSTISRLLLKQTASNLAEKIIAQDLTRTLGTAIDAAAINGSGASGQPTGVVNTSGVNAVSGASWALATQVNAVKAVANANGVVDPTALGWVTTPNVAALLAQRFEATSNVNRLWKGDVDSGTIDTAPALTTLNCPAATAVFGDWSQLFILSWGPGAPIEIEVNPFSGGFAAGDVQMRAFLAANIVVRNPTSFTVVTSIT